MAKRTIIYEGKQIKDEFPELPVKVLQKMLASDYPEIINASFTQKIDEKTGDLVIDFGKSVVGTRG